MISELLHGRRKGFIVVPKGKLGSGWRGFGFHLRKAIALGTLAINLPPQLLPGFEYKASKSFAAAEMQGRQIESKTHRQAAAESSQNDGSRGHKGKHLMLDSRNSNLANPGFQTQDPRESSLGKEKENAEIGAKISPVFLDGTEGGVNLDLCIRLERGSHGKWEISWSKVIKVDPSVGQVPNPKPIDFNKPKHKPVPSVGQIPNPKPFDYYKPKQKPVFKWKPKPSQPSMTQYQTHPHSKYSSQVPPSHLISSASSKAGSNKADAKLTLTHLEPTCTEKFLLVLDNSDASVIESLCSNASVDESLCSDGDMAL